jgi:hypothetical protein
MGALTENLKPRSRRLFEEAIDDAQYLVAYAASKCDKPIKPETITPLITAKRIIDEHQEVDAEFEAKFWLAYQDVWELVKPRTAESIKANMTLESASPSNRFGNMPLLGRWLERRTTASKSRKMVDRYIAVTVSTLVLLLIFQIYWVIGNQLTTQLADLLQKETDLSLKISENRQEHSAVEIRYKQNEINSESFKTNGGYYTFYDTPEWQRDILENESTGARLETDLESLKSELERSSAILLVWSNPWQWLIEKSIQGSNTANSDQYTSQIASDDRQIAQINAQLREDPDGSKVIQQTKSQIADLQKQLTVLGQNPEANSDQILTLKSTRESLIAWINQPGIGDQIVSQLNQSMEQFKADKASLERQRQGDKKRESSRQAQLAGQFVLVILQSYILPLLYGILGAGTFVLRKLSREIREVTYSEEAGIEHVSRISLGALAGIMVGWFSFLIPKETISIFGAVSPLALAFLVGYNIELFFSFMDSAFKRFTQTPQQSSSTEKEEQPVASQGDSTTPAQPTVPTGETPATGEVVG